MGLPGLRAAFVTVAKGSWRGREVKGGQETEEPVVTGASSRWSQASRADILSVLGSGV